MPQLNLIPRTSIIIVQNKLTIHSLQKVIFCCRKHSSRKLWLFRFLQQKLIFCKQPVTVTGCTVNSILNDNFALLWTMVDGEIRPLSE